VIFLNSGVGHHVQQPKIVRFPFTDLNPRPQMAHGTGQKPSLKKLHQTTLKMTFLDTLGVTLSGATHVNGRP